MAVTQTGTASGRLPACWNTCINNPRPLLALGLFALVALVYNALLPIHYDEAYYWLWSKHLAPGYFDHPPMVAYLIRLTTVFSDQVFWIRLGAVLANLGAMWLLYLWVGNWAGQRAAWLCLLLWLVSPTLHANATIITPDAPLVFFWAMGLWSIERALTNGRAGYFYLGGAAVGLMLLSKLIAAFFLLPLAVYLLWRRRDLVRNPHAWGAAVLVLVLCAWMVYWNSQHGWPTIGYQLNRAVGDNAFPDWHSLGEYLGGYLLMLGPVLLPMAVWDMCSRCKHWRLQGEQELLLLISCLVIFWFFLYKSSESKIMLNWYAPIIFALYPLLARRMVKLRMVRVPIAALLCSLLIVLLVRFPWLTGLEYSPLVNNYTYRQAIGEFAPQAHPGELLCSDYHTSTAMLIYYLGDSHQVRNSFAVRGSQFDFWPQPQGNTCLALVKRSSIRPYHWRDCQAISRVWPIQVQVSSSHKAKFLGFRCVVKQQTE